MPPGNDRTIQKTEWTAALLEDLCTSLQREKDDATVRAFAKELMDDKQLPVEYLSRKVKDQAGVEAAQRLERLLLGKTVTQSEKGGAPGRLLRKLLNRT